MDSVQVFDDKEKLAVAAAQAAVDVLKTAVAKNGNATWVLAGGSTPLAAYEVIAKDHRDALDWSKVTVVLGDERIGPLDSPDNNWHAIDQIIGNLPTRKLRPQSDKSAEDAAADYTQQLASVSRFDLVWLGVGSDGHTLSIFPRHSSLLPTSDTVIAVHDSPKPPADRISLSLRALQGTANVMILAAGADKKEAIKNARAGGHSPIALAVSIIETHEGKVTWFLDSATATD